MFICDDSSSCNQRTSFYQKTNSTFSIPCSNAECTTKRSNVELEFDMNLSISDATGTLAQCRLKGSAAEHVLGVKVTHHYPLKASKLLFKT